jgi:hypothetical protein
MQVRHKDQVKESAMSKVLRTDIHNFMSLQCKKEKIDLLEKQIKVLERRLQSSSCEEQCAHCHVALTKFEIELVDLMMPALDEDK